MDAGNNGRAEAILQDGGAVVGNDDGRLAVLVPVVNEPFQRRACKVRVLYLVILVQDQQIRRLVASHDGRFRAAAVERLPQCSHTPWSRGRAFCAGT